MINVGADSNQHVFYMNKALLQARLAAKKDEVPVGAVLVDNSGVILAKSFNKVESHNCQASHAEVLAIRSACKKIGDWRLNGCTLYVTLEPCLMCLGLAQLARLKRIVFGAESPIFGVKDLGLCGSQALTKVYAKSLIVEGGVCVEECVDLLQKFFGSKRKKKGK